MATDKNFIVKHGLEVGGVNIVDSSGILSQSLITSVPSGAVASTQSVGDSSTALATTAYVRGEIDALINSAPGTLNTLDELAAAINDDAAFNTTLTNAVALKAPLASPTFTGTVTAPTLSVTGTSTFAGGTTILPGSGTTIAKLMVRPNSGAAGGYKRASIELQDETGANGWDIKNLADGSDQLTINSKLSNTFTRRLELTSGGDFSLYEDTGATARVFWDASAESLGIGTDSPAATLEVQESGITVSNAQAFVANFIGEGYGTGQVLVSDSATLAADVGGEIQFGGKYSGNTLTEWASVGGYKENGNNGNYSGYFAIKTRAHGGSQTEKMRVSADQHCSFRIVFFAPQKPKCSYQNLAYRYSYKYANLP